MDYEAKAREIDANIETCGSLEEHRRFIANALREAVAEAYEDAARDVQCFDWEKGSQSCEPCDDCVQAARLRGKAAAIREKKP